MTEENPTKPDEQTEVPPQSPEGGVGGDQSNLSVWMDEMTRSGRTARDMLTCAYTENSGLFWAFQGFDFGTKVSPSAKPKEDKSQSKNSVVKVAILIGLLATLALRIYSSTGNNLGRDVHVVSAKADEESARYFELGLTPGPPEILRQVLSELEKRAANPASGLDELGKKRLLFLQDLKAKGRL